MDGGSTFPGLRPARRALQLDPVPVQPVARLEHFADLAGDLACALDPVAFARRAGIEPDPWQCDVLRSPARQLLLNCSRQAGKSTITACLAVWTAMYRPGSLVLIFAPGQRQAVELFKKVLGFARMVETFDADAESSQRVELSNGSRVVALPGSAETVRGYSAPALIVVDEAAFVEDELRFAVAPMLATSGGRFIGLSTPWGKRGWWHKAWAEGGDDWQRIEVPATACPRISTTFLEQERRNLPAHRFASEYECAFVDTEDSVFASDLLRAAVTPDLTPIMPGFVW